MTIKITLPEGNVPKLTNSLKVFTDEGYEIKGITNIKMDLNPNDLVEATITVLVSEFNLLEGVQGIILPDGEEEKE